MQETSGWTQLGKIGRIELGGARTENGRSAAACGGVCDGMKIPTVEPDVFKVRASSAWSSRNAAERAQEPAQLLPPEPDCLLSAARIDVGDGQIRAGAGSPSRRRRLQQAPTAKRNSHSSPARFHMIASLMSTLVAVSSNE